MLDMVKNYLNGEEYFICLYKNYIYFNNYLEIIKFSDTLISLKFNKFIININGNNLRVKKMENKELLIEGNIINVEKIYV